MGKKRFAKHFFHNDNTLCKAMDVIFLYKRIYKTSAWLATQSATVVPQNIVMIDFIVVYYICFVVLQ
jgi:hypothetical protein